MAENYISTKEAAGLLGVTETTVKRWAESSRLKCVKTLGGHRKFTLQDIEAFAKENNLSFKGVTQPLPSADMEQLAYALFSKRTDIITGIIFNSALQGDRNQLFELFNYMIKNRIKYVYLVDEIIKPVMQKIGDMWQTGELTIIQEHLASDTVKTALSRITSLLPKQKVKNKTVLCACAEKETHDLGIQSVAFELELQGYTLQYLGANTPFKEFSDSIKKLKPDFALLSATAPALTRKEMLNGIKSAAQAAKSAKVKLILGGSYFSTMPEDDLKGYVVLNSAKETRDFFREHN